MLFSIANVDPNKLFNYKILLYSLSSVFYFFVSIFLIQKTLLNLKIASNINHLLLIFLGSGLPYFAFERYSMTHIYEVFTISLIFYLSSKFYSYEDENKNLYAFLIPFVTILSLLVRWTNYYVLFLPIIFKLLFIKKLNKSASLLRTFSAYISIVFSFLGFLFINYLVYGFVGLNLNKVYGNAGSKLDYFLNSTKDLSLFLKQNFLYFSKILFSEEFGILWFSPIIFLGGIFTLVLFLKETNHCCLEFYFFIIFTNICNCFGLDVYSIVIWL